MIHAGWGQATSERLWLEGRSFGPWDTSRLRRQCQEWATPETDKHARGFPQCQNVLGSKFTRSDAFKGGSLLYSRFPWAEDTVQGLRHLLFLQRTCVWFPEPTTDYNYSSRGFSTIPWLPYTPGTHIAHIHTGVFTHTHKERINRH